MAKIRETLQDIQPDDVFNMDETGLFFQCLPNRSRIAAEQRRAAGGAMAMKPKEPVTLVLACNATGTLKVPVAVTGKSASPLCFRPGGCKSTLPFIYQEAPGWTALLSSVG